MDMAMEEEAEAAVTTAAVDASKEDSKVVVGDILPDSIPCMILAPFFLSSHR